MNNRKKAWIVITTIFIFGLVAGIAIDRFGLGNRDPRRHHRKPPDFKEIFTKELNLNTEQQVKLDTLLVELRTKVDEARKKNVERYDKARHEFNENFIQILDPQQKQKFEQMLKDFDDKRKKKERKE
ncbi:hypothetical protein JW935_03050 [candidate division KSB1 bacterium]|nr:hypothetical protein [candidate division KSB1 bacterium]